MGAFKFSGVLAHEEIEMREMSGYRVFRPAYTCIALLSMPSGFEDKCFKGKVDFVSTTCPCDNLHSLQRKHWSLSILEVSHIVTCIGETSGCNRTDDGVSFASMVEKVCKDLRPELRIWNQVRAVGNPYLGQSSYHRLNTIVPDHPVNHPNTHASNPSAQPHTYAYTPRGSPIALNPILKCRAQGFTQHGLHHFQFGGIR